MYQRASNSGGGDSKIPFKFSVYQSRVRLDSQNCYIWNDNGIVKMHLELNFTSLTSVSSSGGLMNGGVPINVVDMGAGFTADGGTAGSTTFAIGGNSGGTMMSFKVASGSSLSSGKQAIFNRDIVCDWDTSA